MNDITHLVDELDRIVPKEERSVRFYQQGGGPDESAVQATPNGYRRLGIELLRAAAAPPIDSAHPNLVDVDLDYLMCENSPIHFQLLERHDTMPPEAAPALSRFDRVFPFLLLGVFVAGAILALIGLGTVVSWVL